MHGVLIAFMCIICGFGVVVSNPRDLMTCPNGCECDTSIKLRVKCSGNQWTEEKVGDLLKYSLMKHIQQLDLSKNNITRLDVGLLRLPGLKKLNLSENQIRIIERGAFAQVPGLINLDISFNYLHNVSREIFTELSSLERLKLRKNNLTRIDKFLFNDLKQLKALDLSENPWHCDCSLAWIPSWLKSNGIKLQPPGKCETPELSAGTSLKRFEPACVEIGSLELTPSHDQVVFAGDELTLRCRGIGADVDHVQWAWPEADATEILVTDKTKSAHGLVESTVRISRLAPQHTGQWVCHQLSVTGNDSAAVSVLVLSDSTQYCPSATTKDNKGVYFWPRSVAGNEVELECAADGQGTVTHTCNINGQWEDLNTSQCTFISERTRILERLSRENLTMTDPLTAKAALLLNLTRNIDDWTDPIDLVFIAQTVDMTCAHAPINSELAAYLMDIMVEILSVPKTMVSHPAAAHVRNCLKHLGDASKSLDAHKPQLAVESLTTAPDTFNGLTCVWEGFPAALRCSTNSRGLLDAPGRDIKAAFDLPASLFSNAAKDKTIQLWINMFANGNFFPDCNNDVYISSIVGVSTAHQVDPFNLTDPVSVTIKYNPRFGADLAPVIWDEEKRAWLSDGGCVTDYVIRDLYLFRCNRLGYYAIRQEIRAFRGASRSTLGEAIHYSGSCVLLICLLVTLLTYIFCNTAIQMSRRTKHALANTWLSIFLLCFLFSFGALETEDIKLCEIIGLALHYFSLTTLLWILVSVNHMHKRLSKNSVERPADDLPVAAAAAAAATTTPIQKPILGLYLVGWGIGLIVCGISGAVHLRDYAQPNFCFLGAGPALSAILVPTAILLILIAGFFVFSLCAIRNNDINGQLSDGTQGTEHVDLELLGETGCTDRVSTRSELTDSEDVDDPEHVPLIQLKAHFIVLVLLISGWCCAALATTASLDPIFPQQETIADCLYSIMTLALGSFVLFFYCVARSDVRARWSAWCRLMGSPRRCCRTRSVSDTLQQPAAPITNRPASVNSGLTGRSSSSHRTKAVLELNNCESSAGSGPKHANNMNLVAMHRQVYRSNNSMPTYQEISHQTNADAFYNPRQIIVARKFFKRQRRNRRNELGMRRRGDGGGTSEGEPWRPSAESAVFLSSDMENNSELANHLLRYGSKINNTNIHIAKRDNVSVAKNNPNVLSEEEDEHKVLLSRLVIGAEEETAAGAVVVPDCRSVQLQCSLDDSSDSFCHKIDSLRLVSDESCASPPHYVTVVDPTYGVVKVTMSDYNQQSHRLSLAADDNPIASRERKLCKSLPASPDSRHVPEHVQTSLPASPSGLQPLEQLPLLARSDSPDQWLRPESPHSPARRTRRRPSSQILVETQHHKRSLRRSLSLSPKSRKSKYKKETSV